MAWAYKCTLTADHTQCGSADSSNFAVLVSLTNALLKSTGNGGQITQTGSQTGSSYTGTMPFDLIFTSDSLGATKIPWEIESYNASTGLLIAWVKVGTLSHTSDTVFYCFFGDSAVSTQQNTSTLSPANVWDASSTAVWHLPDGSTLSLLDSTSNGNTLTNTNSATAATGAIGGGVALASASSQELKRTANLTSTTALTTSCWIKNTSFPNAYNTAISFNEVTGSANFFDLHIKSSGKLAMYVGNGPNYDGSGTYTLSTGVWYHLMMVYSNATGLIGYVNGQVDGTGVSFGNLAVSTTQVEVGNNQPFSPRYVNGSMDEVRVSSTARAASWALSEYNNQVSGSTFLSASFSSLSSGSKLFRPSLLNGLGAGGPFFANPLG